jgi:hypothetical protein
MYRKCFDSMTGGEAQCILRLKDNAFIPFDEGNTDYQAYLAWVATGNTAEEWDSDGNR